MIKRYSIFVLISKKISLLIVLLTIITSVFVIFKDDQKVRLNLNSNNSLEFDSSTSNRSKIINPKFCGTHLNNEQYIIEAKVALKEENNFKLIEPQALINFSDQKSLILNAGQSILNLENHEKIIELIKDVRIKYDDYYMNTEHTILDIKNNYFVGHLPIVINGDFGILKAKSFEIFYNQKKFIFNNDVKVVFKQR